MIIEGNTPSHGAQVNTLVTIVRDDDEIAAGWLKAVRWNLNDLKLLRPVIQASSGTWRV